MLELETVAGNSEVANRGARIAFVAPNWNEQNVFENNKLTSFTFPSWIDVEMYFTNAFHYTSKIFVDRCRC